MFKGQNQSGVMWPGQVLKDEWEEQTGKEGNGDGVVRASRGILDRRNRLRVVPRGMRTSRPRGRQKGPDHIEGLSTKPRSTCFILQTKRESGRMLYWAIDGCIINVVSECGCIINVVSEILSDQHCREWIPMQRVSGWKEWRASCIIQEKNDKDLRRQPW